MKLISKIYRRALLRPLLAAAVLAAALDFWFETSGLPAAWHPHVKAFLQHAGMRGSFTHLRAGVVHGFVFLNPVFLADTSAGPVRLEASEILCRPNLRQAFRGRMVIDRFAVSNALVTALAPPPTPSLQVSVSMLQGHRGSDDRCHLQFKAVCEGVTLTGTSTLDNFSQFPAMLAADQERPPAAFSPSVHAAVSHLTGLLQQCRWSENDAFVNVDASFDCLAPGKSALSGNFSLGHALLGQIVITKLRGDFSLAHGRLALSRLQWFLSRSEIVQGDIAFDLNAKTVEAALQGRLFPATLLHLAGAENGSLSQVTAMTTPIHFTARLPSAPWEWRKLTPRLDCRFDAMTLYGVNVHRGRFVLTSQERHVTLSELYLQLNPANTEWVAGELSCNLESKTMAADLDGELPVLHLARQFGLQVPAAWFGSEKRNVRLQLKLAESPISSWRQWQATATVSARELPIRDIAFKEPRLSLELNRAVLSMTEATAGLPGLPADVLRLTAQADLASLVGRQPTTVAFTAQVLAPVADAPGAAMASAFEWQGEAVYTPEQQRLRLDSRGAAYPDRLYQTYQGPLHLPASDILARLRCPRDPVTFTLQVPDTELHDRPSWIVRAELQGKNGGFGPLDIAEASCQLEITTRETRFLNLKGTTAAGEPMALDIHIQYDPFILTLKDISLTGRPEIAEAFILPELAHSIYLQIWEHVRWDQDHPALITVPALVYQSGSTDNDWQLTMASSLQVKNASYRDNRLDEVNLEVHLNLPDNLRVAPVVLTRPDGDVTAEFAMTFAGVPQCDLKIVKSDGSVDPRQILLAINPEWMSFLEPITFSPQTKVTCEGSFFLSGEPLLRLRGTIDTPQCSFRDWTAEQVTANWTLSSGQVRWNVTNASYLGGDLKTTGLYDLEAKAGNALIIAHNVSLDRFSAKLGLSEKAAGAPPVPGVVHAECRLDMLHNWAGRPFHVEGYGHVSVRQAELWEVPLFSKLGYLLELTTFSWLRQRQEGGLGKITSLDADLEFLGSRLSVPQFSTDGTIIALSGEGEYSWEKDRLFFQVSGEALKEVSILSFVLKPLTWAFHAELSGTRQKNEWKLRTALRKIFSTD